MNGIAEFLRSIGTTRLVAGIAILSLVGGAFTVAMFRVADRDMSVLFTDLDLQDAGEILDEIRSRKIPYEQRDNGRTILVPQDSVLDLRMAFASDGLPARGIAGYELLDNQNALGTTSFLQNVNYVRALEGELGRTISSLAAIRGARVFLNLPKRELFSKEKPPATASIQVNTVHGSLTRSQIRGIQFLVASAVEGLNPQRVSIIDEQGNVLASGQADGPDAAASGLEERRLGLEQRLQSDIQAILSRIVGLGNARVRVTAEMNFNRVVEETRSFDPERQVVLSTRTVEESASSEDQDGNDTVTVNNNMPDAGTAPGTSRSNESENRLEETVNYENSLTKRTEVQEAGRLERLSVAVVLNQKQETAEDGTVTFVDRTPAEIANIEQLVKAAVGFDEDRGDQVSVISTPFAIPDRLPEEEKSAGMFGMENLDITRIVEAVALVILALIFLFTLQPLIKRLTTPREAMARAGAALDGPGDVPQLPSPEAAGAAAQGEEALPPGATPMLPGPQGGQALNQAIDIAQVQGQVKESSVKKVAEIVSNHPEESMSILRAWLHETA